MKPTFMRLSSSSFLEKLRLQDLYAYNILDSGIEAEFESLVDLARSILKCPIAAISFVDSDRQYFKAVRGLQISETPREISFCSHTVKHDRVLVIKDAAKDHRFKDNPLVYDDPGIRFYAGAPIITSAGFKIGSVCLIDTKPRQFSPQCQNALEQVSRQVSRLLELRLENKVLKFEANKAVYKQISLFHDSLQRQEEQNFIVSNELHESIAQDLAAARLYLDSSIGQPDEALLAENRDNLSRLIERTKGLSVKMFPSTFPDIGLGEMVEDLGDRFAGETGIQVAVQEGSGKKIGKEQRIILFRIVEEQFKNIRQHSLARNVSVRIETKNEIEVCIVDDGVGFSDVKTREGYGINKMLSLTQYYGGSLDFFKPSPQGCGLRITMPVVE
jgi:signal transduction histidine kinase